MLGSESIWNTYVKVERVGQGVYGKVYKAKDRRDPTKWVAIKKTHMEHDGVSPTTVREIAILKRISGHKNIVQLRFDYEELNA